MRDLARIDLSTPRKSISKIALRFLVLVAIVMGAFGFLRSRFAQNKTGGSSIVLQEAPRGLTPVFVDNTVDITEEGVDLVTQTAKLVDVRYGGNATGVATRSFGGGTYILTVEATLPDPKDTLYQVWLVGGQGLRSIDYMRGSGTSWSLTLRDTDKYSKYDGIWVTLERTKEFDTPEEHVLEGSFE